MWLQFKEGSICMEPLKAAGSLEKKSGQEQRSNERARGRCSLLIAASQRNAMCWAQHVRWGQAGASLWLEAWGHPAGIQAELPVVHLGIRRNSNQPKHTLCDKKLNQSNSYFCEALEKETLLCINGVRVNRKSACWEWDTPIVGAFWSKDICFQISGVLNYF